MASMINERSRRIVSLLFVARFNRLRKRDHEIKKPLLNRDVCLFKSQRTEFSFIHQSIQPERDHSWTNSHCVFVKVFCLKFSINFFGGSESGQYFYLSLYKLNYSRIISSRYPSEYKLIATGEKKFRHR